MPLEIPGYYYDEEKKRYFKIEDNRTAPPEASWSSGNVKRRKIESKEAEMKKEREARNAGRVKRADKVWGEPLLGGCFFAREIGGLRGRGEVMEDLRKESWALGLRDKGTLRFWVDGVDHSHDIIDMYIGGEETAGRNRLGVGYAVSSLSFLGGSYIPRDDIDQIDFGDAAMRYPRTDFTPWMEARHMHLVATVNYHAPSQKMLFTCLNDANFPVAYFCPALSDVDAGEWEPAWRRGGSTAITQIRAPAQGNYRRDGKVNTLRPAPASSPLTAVVGTDTGVMKLQGDTLTWLDWRKPTYHPRPRGAKGPSIFSLDFLAQNPAHVILAAGRSRDIAILDTRLAQHAGETSYIRHTSSVAHVRSVGDYGVLAAGPKSAMAVYDIRFSPRNIGSHPTLHGKQDNLQPLPVVTFPEYKNQDHILQIGFDVSDSKGGGLGIVAAAQDDGTVALFSLASGKKLRSSKALDDIRLVAPPRLGGDPYVRTVKSMMFQTLPGDAQPSLFVGRGKTIKKLSFGINYSKKDGLFVEEEY
ncbi:hypothetical protein V8F20_005270 [Naviculisporaceae sp. PSN 640]